MRVVLLDTARGARVAASLRALRQGAPGLEVRVVPEGPSREATLNRALEVAGRSDDLLLVADDIVPTAGWWEALRAGLTGAEVLGFSMLASPSGPVQDRGFDLVEVDGELLLEARDRGADPKALPAFHLRPCDAVCGCALAVRREVLERIPGFSEDGCNRWGEMLFCVAARRAGFRVAVLGHYLVHRGRSTKDRGAPELSSESRALERRLWRERVLPHLADLRPRRRLRRTLDPAARRLLAGARGPVLVYGVGTAAELVADALPPGTAVTFCTGLPDEAGSRFRGRSVADVDDLDPGSFGWIVMTPRSRAAAIFRERVAPRLPRDFRGRVSEVEVRVQDGELVHLLRDLAPWGEGLDPRVATHADGTAPGVDVPI